MRRQHFSGLCVAGALLAAVGLQASETSSRPERKTMDGGRLFEFHGCINCHGAQGRNPISKRVPKIGGLDWAYIYREATNILAGKRDSEDAKLMHSAMSYHASCDAPPNDAELRVIAAWLATQ
jgi:cytochrome c553